MPVETLRPADSRLTGAPFRILHKGPDYFRRQTDPSRKLSAVERLEADKAKYVKSQQVALNRQAPIIRKPLLPPALCSAPGRTDTTSARKLPRDDGISRERPTGRRGPALDLDVLNDLINVCDGATACSSSSSSSSSSPSTSSGAKSVSSSIENEPNSRGQHKPSPCGPSLCGPSLCGPSPCGPSPLGPLRPSENRTVTAFRSTALSSAPLGPQRPSAQTRAPPLPARPPPLPSRPPPVPARPARAPVSAPLCPPPAAPVAPVAVRRVDVRPQADDRTQRRPLRAPVRLRQTAQGQAPPLAAPPSPALPSPPPYPPQSPLFSRAGFVPPASPAFTRLSNASSKGSGRKHPALHRSKSDLSDRFSRANADLERFFNYCGLDPGEVEGLGGVERFTRANSDIVSVSKLRSVSTPSSECEDERARDEGDEDEPKACDRVPYGISVIERNARVIKWLYGIRQATSVSNV